MSWGAQRTPFGPTTPFLPTFAQRILDAYAKIRMAMRIDGHACLCLDILLGEVDVVVLGPVDDLDVDALVILIARRLGGHTLDVECHNDQCIAQGIVPDTLDSGTVRCLKVELDAGYECREEGDGKAREQAHLPSASGCCGGKVTHSGNEERGRPAMQLRLDDQVLALALAFPLALVLLHGRPVSRYSRVFFPRRSPALAEGLGRVLWQAAASRAVSGLRWCVAMSREVMDESRACAVGASHTIHSVSRGTSRALAQMTGRAGRGRLARAACLLYEESGPLLLNKPSPSHTHALPMYSPLFCAEHSRDGQTQLASLAVRQKRGLLVSARHSCAPLPSRTAASSSRKIVCPSVHAAHMSGPRRVGSSLDTRAKKGGIKKVW